MVVGIEFICGQNEIVPERDLSTALATPNRPRPEIWGLCGGLVFSHDGAEFRIVDEVTWVVWTLALETLPELAKSGSAEFSFWSVDCVLTFERDQDEVTISGERQDAARFPIRALMAGTHDAAVRLLDLVDRHWPEETRFDRPALRQQFTGARAVTDAL